MNFTFWSFFQARYGKKLAAGQNATRVCVIFELVTAWVTGSFGGKTCESQQLLFFEGEEFNRVKIGEILMKIH